MRATSWAVLGVSAVVAAACVAWLFRVEADIGPTTEATVHLVYRWGRPFELRADTNGDGRVDFKANYRGMDDFDYHSRVEYWEDRDFDGTFEIHGVPEPHGGWLFEVDFNGDGIYEPASFDPDSGLLKPR